MPPGHWATTRPSGAGRLSLNPLVHIDRVGTILLPGFLLVSQLLTIGHVGFMFGWAKPVPVAAWRFHDPRRGMMLVAAAGPAMNFVLAWLGGLAWHLLDRAPDGAQHFAADFLGAFIIYNLVLGLFNLLPIPPLDGGRIAVGLLPLPAARIWGAHRTRRHLRRAAAGLPAAAGPAGSRHRLRPGGARDAQHPPLRVRPGASPVVATAPSQQFRWIA